MKYNRDQPMKKLLKPNIPITLMVIVCLLFSITPTARSFISREHHSIKRWMSDLIKRVHEDHWDIGYRYGDDCQVDSRPKAKDLEEAITKALQVWLQPLRDMKTKQPIVNDFRYKIQADLRDNNRKHLDLGITFYCDSKGRSRARISGDPDIPPHVEIDGGTDVHDQRFISPLIHELGHAMGLGDTYVWPKTQLTKGGSKLTRGTQPAAVMAFHLYPHTNQHLSEDDKNGIIWLYKVEYEGLDPADCFYPNYKFEADPDGCVPKYPLIFEIRQGHENFAFAILNEDPDIDINAQDMVGYTALHYAVKGGHRLVIETLLARDELNVNLRDESGSTALHYAVLNGSPEVLALLLSHPDIWVRPLNKAGKSPITLARDLGNDAFVDKLKNHPNQRLAVSAKKKLTTTWASLKRR